MLSAAGKEPAGRLKEEPRTSPPSEVHGEDEETDVLMDGLRRWEEALDDGSSPGASQQEE